MSLKKDIINKLSVLPKLEGLEQNKIILATSIGLVTGRLPNEEEFSDSTNPQYVPLNVCSNAADEYRNKLALSEKAELPGNDGCIYLVDVVIKSSEHTYSLPFLALFYDQIIGASIGSN